MFCTVLDNESLLLQRVAEGHQLSFNIIYRFYLDRVYSFALRIVKQKEWAEEIVQDVFTNLWRYGEKLRNIENLHAWLRTLARHCALKLLRKQALLDRVEREFKTESSSVSKSVDEGLIYKDINFILNQAIESLPPQQRKVYTYCHIEGFTYEEAAELLGLSKLTVHSHMKQSLRNIRIFVAKNYPIVFLLVFQRLF